MWTLVLWPLLVIVTSKTSIASFLEEDDRELDLLSAIPVPIVDPHVVVEYGSDGFLAFRFEAGSDIKSPFKIFFPDKFFPEFSISFILRLVTPNGGGFIFSVVNPLETIVQFGVRVNVTGQHESNVSILYTDLNTGQYISQTLVSFRLPTSFSTWTTISLAVREERIDVSLNCVHQESAHITKIPSELLFDAASTLYLGQAGPIIQGPLNGVLQELKVYGKANSVLHKCKAMKSDVEASGEDGWEETIPKVTHPAPPHEPGLLGKSMKGEKGDKGDKGEPGQSIRGNPGPPGPPGPPGLSYSTSYQPPDYGFSGSGDNEFDSFSSPGPAGPPGICHCNMSELLRDFMMPQMMEGPPGIPGIDGKTGPPGPAGLIGAPGERGATGPKGDKGDRGDQGPLGAEGFQGQKGEPGIDGSPGIPGAIGPPGPPGPSQYSNLDPSWRPRTMFKEAIMGAGYEMGRPGSPGPKGENGNEGPQGPKGEKGVQGDKGERGEAGIKGPKGDRGHQGQPGLQGFKGEQGNSGIDGLPGIPGENGRPAVKGEKGEAGPPGNTGPPGPPGSTFSMEDNEDLVSYGGGVKGEPGLKGDKGEIGLKGEKGNEGERGPQGFPGLNGMPGAQGDKGDRGPEGSSGPKGERGPIGPSGGEKGERGKRGRRGKPGPPGLPGKPVDMSKSFMGYSGRLAKGQKGEPGELTTPFSMKGEKGDPGKDGEKIQYIPVPGPPGPPGPPGAPGVSVVGEKGEPGPPGLSHGRPVYVEPTVRQGPRGSLEELKALKELRELKSESRNPDTNPYDSPKIVPGAVSFENMDSMSKMSYASPVGTLAYITDEEALLVRVNKGWQYISLGSLIPIPTQPPPTTETFRPPFESSNLVNSQAVPMDGPMLRLAALNEAYSGGMKGQRGADYSCYRQARRAGLRGTFRAFITSRVQSLDNIVKIADRDLPVVNLKGDVLFNSWKDVFMGASLPSQARIYSFSGKNIMSDYNWPQKYIWHGSQANGERAMEEFCEGWESDSAERVGMAASLHHRSHGKIKLLAQEPMSCSHRFAVLCIEVASSQGRRRRRNAELSQDEYTELLENIFSDERL